MVGCGELELRTWKDNVLKTSLPMHDLTMTVCLHQASYWRRAGRGSHGLS